MSDRHGRHTYATINTPLRKTSQDDLPLYRSSPALDSNGQQSSPAQPLHSDVLERINLVHQKAEGKQRDASELKEKIEEYRGDLEEISQEEDQVRTVDQIAELTLEKKVMSRALEILMRRLTDCEKEYNELAAERDDLINTLNETNEELNKTDPSFYRGPVFLDVAPREESESAEVSTTQNAKA